MRYGMSFPRKLSPDAILELLLTRAKNPSPDWQHGAGSDEATAGRPGPT